MSAVNEPISGVVDELGALFGNASIVSDEPLKAPNPLTWACWSGFDNGAPSDEPVNSFLHLPHYMAVELDEPCSADHNADSPCMNCPPTDARLRCNGDHRPTPIQSFQFAPPPCNSGPPSLAQPVFVQAQRAYENSWETGHGNFAQYYCHLPPPPNRSPALVTDSTSLSQPFASETGSIGRTPYRAFPEQNTKPIGYNSNHLSNYILTSPTTYPQPTFCPVPFHPPALNAQPPPLSTFSPAPPLPYRSSTYDTNPNHLIRTKMVYVEKFGGFGVGAGEFTEPSGVCVHPVTDDIIIADTNNHRVQVFDAAGRFKFMFGKYGRWDGQMMYPNRVCIDVHTNTFVISERAPTHQIQIYSAVGEFIRRFGSDLLCNPRGLCVDKESRIIVVECKVMRIVIFDVAGQLLNLIHCGPHLSFPNNVCVSSNCEIYISDNGDHCVKVFDYSGRYLRKIGGPGVTNYPIAVAINQDGEVVVIDNHNNFNITIYSQEGQLLSGYESKVKHAQCLDAALTREGHVVMCSKDYRTYVYRYRNPNLYCTTDPSIVRASVTSTSSPVNDSPMQCYIPEHSSSLPPQGIPHHNAQTPRLPDILGTSCSICTAQNKMCEHVSCVVHADPPPSLYATLPHHSLNRRTVHIPRDPCTSTDAEKSANTENGRRRFFIEISIPE